MTPNQGRDREISRREREKMRAELIVDEMAEAVRFLGGSGPAKQQNNTAARAARQPVTVIERLRWRKIKRVPADIADSVREAVQRHNEESLARAKHELFVARKENALLAARLGEVDPDFYGPEIARLRGPDSGAGSEPDFHG
jgi:hypothetical protein